MDEVPANRQPFPGQGSAAWIDAYQEEMLQARDEATIETYTRVLEKFTARLALRPGNSGQFRPQAITRTAIEDFLDTLPSYSYKKQARSPLYDYFQQGERRGSRWMEVDGGWHPPLVAAAQSEGTPCGSQVHQRP